jgi:hypothetical protein
VAGDRLLIEALLLRSSKFTGRLSDNSSDGSPVFSAPLFNFLLPEADNEAYKQKSPMSCFTARLASSGGVGVLLSDHSAPLPILVSGEGVGEGEDIYCSTVRPSPP